MAKTKRKPLTEYQKAVEKRDAGLKAALRKRTMDEREGVIRQRIAEDRVRNTAWLAAQPVKPRWQLVEAMKPPVTIT